MGNIDYINQLKNQTQKKKAITITLDENVLDSITEISDKLEISKNQIISDITSDFVKDYLKTEAPNYYIINSNNAYMPYGHLHMLLGNRASAWEDTKSAIEGLEPGDYIFIYMNEKGIIASGTVKSKFMINDYSLVNHYKSKEKNETEYVIGDEYFVYVDYDKKCLKSDNTIDENRTVELSEYKEKVSKKLLNRTKVQLSSEEGKKLKELFLTNG